MEGKNLVHLVPTFCPYLSFFFHSKTIGVTSYNKITESLAEKDSLDKNSNFDQNMKHVFNYEKKKEAEVIR